MSRNIYKKRYAEEISPSDESFLWRSCVSTFAQINNISNITAYHFLKKYFDITQQMGLNGSDACDLAMREAIKDFRLLYLRPDTREGGQFMQHYQEF